MNDDQIAAIAWDGVHSYLAGAEVEMDFATYLNDEWMSRTRLYRETAGNPNGFQVCRDVHDLWLGNKIKEYSGRMQELGEEADLLPFNFLPKQRQIADLLFRNIVVSLVPLWQPTDLGEKE